jgi:host factor-I protein
MGKKGQNLQDAYLNYLRKEKVPVTVYLMNGTRLRGTIKGFDNFVIILKQNVQQLIYKHAVSTITPERDVELKEDV